VADPDDPRLADYTRLTDISLRTNLEAAHGLFIAEGTTVIGKAVRAGYPVRSVLVGESRVRDLDALATGIAGAACAGAGPAGLDRAGPGFPAGRGIQPAVPVYVVPDVVAERLTGYRVHRGALASLLRVELPPVASVLADAHRVVVLEDLVDHGNVGAIFRCAAALGIDAVIVSPRCADPLYRRSVKVSMGAVFAIPYARMTTWYDGLAEIRAAGCAVLALTPDERATPIRVALGKLAAFRRAALLLGTEGDGLSSRWLHEADEAVRIPMSRGARAAGVDSLNVVAAAAIACDLLAHLDRETEALRSEEAVRASYKRKTCWEQTRSLRGDGVEHRRGPGRGCAWERGYR
jgi:tRNA G18 (ribose-2'-O)-methylase SpoU